MKLHSTQLRTQIPAVRWEAATPRPLRTEGGKRPPRTGKAGFHWQGLRPKDDSELGSISRLSKQLERAIATGILLPHQQIPTGMELPGLVALSKRSLVEVFAILEIKGLLYRRNFADRGIYVVDIGTRSLPLGAVTNGGELHLSVIPGVAVSHSFFEQLKAAIRDGVLPEGATLSRARDLAQENPGYSLADIEAAYLALERDGFIRRPKDQNIVTTLGERSAAASFHLRELFKRFQTYGLMPEEVVQIGDRSLPEALRFDPAPAQLDKRSDQPTVQVLEKTVVIIDRSRTEQVVSRSIFSLVEEEIRSGRLPPGSVMPSVGKAAKENRSTERVIRDGYEFLLQAGYLRKRNLENVLTQWWVPADADQSAETRCSRGEDQDCYRAKMKYGSVEESFLRNIIDGIRNRTIRPGSTLRPAREAAALSGISLSLVKKCYRRLLAEGHVLQIERPDPRAEFEVAPADLWMQPKGESAVNAASTDNFAVSRGFYRLTPHTGESVHVKIWEQTRAAIVANHLRPGQILESSITVSRNNDIHYSVVIQAYRRLEAEGFLERSEFNGHPSWVVATRQSRIQLAEVLLRRLVVRLCQLGLPLEMLQLAIARSYQDVFRP